MRWLALAALLSGCFASANGSRACETLPEGCTTFVEQWEQYYPPLSPRCAKRMRNTVLRFIHWSQLSDQCNGAGSVYNTCACAWFDRGLGDKILGRHAWWYIAITTDTLNPEDLIVHEMWHHMHACERDGFDHAHVTFPREWVGVCRIDDVTDRPEEPTRSDGNGG